MRNQYKMLVLDMDDTLLTDDHKISERNYEQLMAAQEAGVKVVLASGRPTPAMTNFAKALNLPQFNSHIIAYNGGVVMDMGNNEEIFNQRLTNQQIHDLYSYAHKSALNIMTYSDSHIISPSYCEYVKIEENLAQMPVELVNDFFELKEFDSPKCIIVGKPEKLQEIKPLLSMAYPDLSVAFSKPFYLEITPKGIDKAASLDRLVKKLDITAEEVIAVGNAGNDLSMVEYAGLGVWVDNVDPELRDRADVIVASNNDDGVAEVVDRFILGQLSASK
ncbi:Cof-type HAD-IIB family hydrolase [Persicobacter diffluens]